jgi:hypothetical protein
MPVIGSLNAASREPYARMLAAFRQGLNETGYVDGRSVTIEYRWAEGQYDPVPAIPASSSSSMPSPRNGYSSISISSTERLESPSRVTCTSAGPGKAMGG